MGRRIGLTLLLVVVGLMTSQVGHAANVIQVVVLPFEVHAREDLAYLHTEIPKLIKAHLSKEGAEILEPVMDPTQPLAELVGRVSEVRKLGLRSGADYVIWGSMTRVGKRFSLDARAIESFGDASPSIFSAEGEGLENLLGKVNALAGDISKKVFKRVSVFAVNVEGNKRIETDAVKRVMKTTVGSSYLPQTLSDDLKKIYKMGYFDDVQVEATDHPEGKIVTFKVKEKPTIRTVLLQGNSEFEDEEIKEQLSLRAGSILNNYHIQNNIERIEELYQDKNFHSVEVSYRIEKREHNQADVEFIIKEGNKVHVEEIVFLGNKAFSDRKLKKIMKTSEKGFFWWITSSGDMDREKLNQDSARLAAFYQNNGFINARVGEPQVEFKEDYIEITVRIDEGPRFKVGQVSITGDLVIPEADLRQQLKIFEEDYFNRQTLRNDVLAVTDLYADEGYAYAKVIPSLTDDAEKLTVDILLKIEKGQQVYFEEIIISGNTITRDKVIRRQLKVYEQELYSGKRLKAGVRNLHRMDYFESIKVDTPKGSRDDLMLLKIDVTEKQTGAFSFGGGYSNTDDFFGLISVTQRNLFGRGQQLQVEARLGGESTRYSVKFTEPWLFDRPLSAGVELYNWDKDYDTYEKHSIGGGVRFSYPVFSYTRAYIAYLYDIGDISEVESDAPDSIKELEGEFVTSKVTTRLQYDSRDRRFNPTEGSNHSITVEYAGLGGDIGFVKTVAETGWFFPLPLFKGLVGFTRAKGGYVVENSGQLLPIFDRFFLGGIDSLRGFDKYDLSPKEINEDGEETDIGGDKFVQFNFELIFPLVKDAGVNGVVFFDTGNVWDNDDDVDFSDLRESAGAGIRWYSPIGPMRIEYGYILDPVDGRGEGGQWEFAMGAAF